MVWFGKIKNGKIQLDPGAQLPEGVTVRIEPVTRPGDSDPVYRLGDGAVDDDLPPDLASQHDHYLYGTPKREG
jgi:hypothetical protein